MNLFTQIEEIVPKLDGWCTVPKATALASAVTSLRPKVIVELGVYGGRSLIPMALALKHVGTGKIIGVDSWDSNASAQGQEGEHANFWGALNHKPIRDTFLSNLDRLELRGFVEVIQMRSSQVTPPSVIDMAHIDANHGPEAIKDVDRFAPCVRVGGLIALDDISWQGGSVSEACKRLNELGFVQLFRETNKDEDWAMFQRIK